MRDLGIALSDRRAVKVLKLVAASAVLCGRRAAQISDLWVLRYVWDREEQIAPLASLIAGRPRAARRRARSPTRWRPPPTRVDGEDLARQLDAAEAEVERRARSGLAAVARLRERVADLADRAAWVPTTPRGPICWARTGQLLKRLG